jgi:hypothetical protein
MTTTNDVESDIDDGRLHKAAKKAGEIMDGIDRSNIPREALHAAQDRVKVFNEDELAEVILNAEPTNWQSERAYFIAIIDRYFSFRTPKLMGNRY